MSYRLTWEFVKMLRRELALTIAEKSEKSRKSRQAQAELVVLRKKIDQEMRRMMREQRTPQDQEVEENTETNSE